MTEDICMKCAHRSVCSFYEPREECRDCNQFMPKNASLEIDENYESILICAERYACGRRTYMPGIVVGYIKPLIPMLSDKTLDVIYNDISSAVAHDGLVDPTIGAPLWVDLYNTIGEELRRRSAIRQRSAK